MSICIGHICSGVKQRLIITSICALHCTFVCIWVNMSWRALWGKGEEGLPDERIVRQPFTMPQTFVPRHRPRLAFTSRSYPHPPPLWREFPMEGLR